ncbi:hypothetical protein [Nocardia sp. NPDC020380]|uniref:hypothetical protein n=1 Tax=Nocardia sp. NPDC020380 TaxID=3364309 RepID=UPI003792110F
MASHRRFRNTVVALSGTLLIASAAGPITAATAAAESAIVVPVLNPSFPDPGQGSGQQPKKEEHLDKAEKLGGGLTTKILDLIADTLKCSLNIALPTVKCS